MEYTAYNSAVLWDFPLLLLFRATPDWEYSAASADFLLHIVYIGV